VPVIQVAGEDLPAAKHQAAAHSYK
jgi:hypothetical protein